MGAGPFCFMYVAHTYVRIIFKNIICVRIQTAPHACPCKEVEIQSEAMTCRAVLRESRKEQEEKVRKLSV